jgi:hypothetical protein
MHSFRTLPRFLLTLVAMGLFAPFALAQDAALSPAPSQEVKDPEHEQERLCRDRWFGEYRRCRSRRWAGPMLVFGGDFGISAMNEGGAIGFNNGVGSVTNAGPAWGASVGVEVFRWLAFEARYVGMYNSAQSSVSPTGSVGYFTTGGAAIIRFTAPLPYVHPYIFGGAGYYKNALIGSSAAKAGSVLLSSSQPGVPLGLGVDVPLTWHVSVGVEATYHFMIGESFSDVTANGIDGGDITTFNGVMRFRL